MSYIKVNAIALILCCELFIEKRNKEIAALIATNKILMLCDPKRAENLRNMALCCKEFMLSMDDFLYLRNEVSVKKLSEMKE